MRSDRFDIVIVGGTEGGVFAAVRAGRAGARVCLVSYTRQVGGVLPSLGALETHYPGNRAPLVNELREAIFTHYSETYGEDSEPFRACTRLEPNNPMLTFEPHVVEQIFDRWLSDLDAVTVLRGYRLTSVEGAESTIEAVNVQSFADGESVRLEADTFLDCTYEGDLAAAAGSPYRIGRESREEHNESFAGRIFARYYPGQFPHEAAQGRLNLRTTWSTLGLISGSTGEGDDNVQAYSFRLCLSDDPENRILPARPEGYDRGAYQGAVESPEDTRGKRYALQHRFLTNTLHDMVANDHIIHGHALPNRKRSWNATNFPGGGKAYAEADWAERERIVQRHLDHALGLLYFLQNDDAIPADIRELALEWGLARDEFAASNNIPEQLYIREARRLVGRCVLTEHDCMIARGLERTPIHHDSIGITEFPLDSLACTTERRHGSMCDGQFFDKELSRPGQIPYRCILPQGIDNLLVPVTPSVTHVVWGTARQTMSVLHLCESAAHAALLASEKGTSVGALDSDALLRRLVENGVMISFFNDFDMATDAPWVAAVQYWGAQGLFDSYDAKPDEPLTDSVAEHWVACIREVLSGEGEPTGRARRASGETGRPITVADWVGALKGGAGQSEIDTLGLGESEVISRGDACRIAYCLK